MNDWNFNEHVLEKFVGGVLVVVAVIILVAGSVIEHMFSAFWTRIVLIAAIILAVFVAFIGIELCIGELDFNSARSKIRNKLHRNDKKPKK